MPATGGTYLSELAVVDGVTRSARGPGAATATVPSGTASSRRRVVRVRDSSGIAFRPPAFWWRRCWTAAPTATCTEAEAAIERLATAPADDGLVIRDIWLLRLRALLARAHGDEAGYRDYRDRYRAMATSLGFEGHMQWAEAMP